MKIIKAIQFVDTPENVCEISDLVGGTIKVDYKNVDFPIMTLEDDRLVFIDDYIVKTDDGTVLVCSPDLFKYILEVI